MVLIDREQFHNENNNDSIESTFRLVHFTNADIILMQQCFDIIF